MQERARTAPMPIDSPRREEQDREGNPSDWSIPITKPMLERKWDGEGEKEGRRWNGYKEVLKVNRIAATESYCRGGKSRRRRHWIRRAGAIYSIHGRANTNLRLDVQTASSLPIPRFFSRLLSPIHDFSLFFHLLLSLFSSFISTFFPLCLVSTLSFFHGPPLLSLDRFLLPPPNTPSTRNLPQQLEHDTSFVFVYMYRRRTWCSGSTRPGLWSSTSSRFGRRWIWSRIIIRSLEEPAFVTLDLCPPSFYRLPLFFLSFFLHWLWILVLQFKATFVTPWNQSR